MGITISFLSASSYVWGYSKDLKPAPTVWVKLFLGGQKYVLFSFRCLFPKQTLLFDLICAITWGELWAIWMWTGFTFRSSETRKGENALILLGPDMQTECGRVKVTGFGEYWRLSVAKTWRCITCMLFFTLLTTKCNIEYWNNSRGVYESRRYDLLWIFAKWVGFAFQTNVRNNDVLLDILRVVFEKRFINQFSKDTSCRSFVTFNFFQILSVFMRPYEIILYINLIEIPFSIKFFENFECYRENTLNIASLKANFILYFP